MQRTPAQYFLFVACTLSLGRCSSTRQSTPNDPALSVVWGLSSTLHCTSDCGHLALHMLVKVVCGGLWGPETVRHVTLHL